ncbi:hypothetical protein [Burkholderia cenocepacia]|uniref:hypothetical protein n=1 Tax=Burkholderia cenocepacia TaxID=95486 RepID=UPI00406CF4CA
MGTEKIALRSLVDKWLAPTPAKPMRVARFGRTANGVFYVCVEVLRQSGPLTIAFFNHEQGVWRVFPPSTSRHQMGASAIAR